MATTSSQQFIDTILNKLKTTEHGLTNSDVQSLFPQLPPLETVKIINAMIAKRLIWIYMQGDEILYKLESDRPNSLKGADNEELVVFKLVKESGNKGIWVRDIRVKSNLSSMQLNKTLKTLENKKCIKSVKTVSAGKKKVYMLYDLEPDSSLTGGAWYNDQDFESEFVDILNEQCYRFLLMKKEKALEIASSPLAQSNAAFATVKEVLKHIENLGISKIRLSENDVTSILNTLVFDDKVIGKTNSDGSLMYKAVNSLLPSPGTSFFPCGSCPVFQHCDSSCRINPKTCEYITKWLEK